MASLIDKAANLVNTTKSGESKSSAVRSNKALAEDNERLLGRLQRMASEKSGMKSRLIELGGELVRTGATTITLSGTALLRGYRGELKLWGVDVPLALGLTGKVGALTAQLVGTKGTGVMHGLADGLFYEGLGAAFQKLGAQAKANKGKGQVTVNAEGKKVDAAGNVIEGTHNFQHHRPQLPENRTFDHPVPGRKRPEAQVVLTPVAKASGGGRLRRAT